jgi:hypothetical protein
VEPTPAAPLQKNQWSTGIQAVNLSDAPLDLQFSYVKAAGGAPTVIDHRDIPAGGQFNSYLPAEGRLTQGTYAGLVSSSGPIGGISVSNGSSNGNTAATIGVNNAAPGTDLVVPLAVEGPMGLNTVLGIQNLTADAPAEVSVVALSAGGETVASSNVTVPAGAAYILDLGREAAFDDLGLNYVGSLRLSAVTPIAVQAVLDFEHSTMAAAGFNGVPASAAGTSLYLPRVRAKVPVDLLRLPAGSFVTRLAIVNPGTAPATLHVNYLGHYGSCVGQAVLGQTRTVPGGGLAWFEVSDDGLPADCAAAARVAADQPVLAVAVESSEAPGVVRTAAAFNAFTVADAGRHQFLSLLRNQHLSVRISSDVTVQNTGTEFAQVSLHIQLVDGTVPDCATGCQVTLAPGAAHTFRAEEIHGLPANRFGWGTLDSTQPVVVTITDISRFLATDATIFSSLPMTSGAAAGGPLAFPINAYNGMFRRPGPPLTPYEPPLVDPPSTSPLAGVRGIHQLFLPTVRTNAGPVVGGLAK